MSTSVKTIAATQFITQLSEATGVAECGGKAARLGEMLRLGLSVPDGLVITDRAFQHWLGKNQLGTSIEALVQTTSSDNPASIARAADDIKSLVMAAALPSELIVAVEASVPHLLSQSMVAVRSSACGEDSTDAAFAGQLDSFLNVNSMESLLRSVQSCWASYWSHRSLAYQRARGQKLRGMAVIVQQQVDAAYSGVLFTRDVQQTESTEMIAEYCAGTGEALVSGDIQPRRLIITSDGWLELGEPNATAWGSDKPDAHLARPAASADGAHLIDEAVVAKLADAGRSLEDHFGGPQDIEWAVDHVGQLHLVQCRPITAFASKPKGVVWSNANVNENFPDPICPLLYSIASKGYYHYFRNLGLAFGIARERIDAIEYPLRNIIGTHGGRIYYNLSNVHAVLRAAPFGEFLAQSFNQFVGATDLHPPRSIPRDAPERTVMSAGSAAQCANLSGRPSVNPPRSGSPTLPQGGCVGTRAPRGDTNSQSQSRASRWRERRELLRITFAARRRFKQVEQRVAVFEETVDHFASHSHPDRIATRQPTELLDLWRRFMEIRCNWTDAAMADASSMISYGLCQRLLTQRERQPERGRESFSDGDVRETQTTSTEKDSRPPRHDAEQAAVTNRLLTGLRNIVSGLPTQRLWELSRLVRKDASLCKMLTSKSSEAVWQRIQTDESCRELRDAIDDFLEQYGFRCSGELMLTTPSYQENPAALIAVIRAFADRDGESPEKMLAEQEQNREQETKRVLKDLRRKPLLPYLPWPRQDFLARRLLRWTQRSIACRERARLKQALLYSRVRRVALAIGDRLVDASHLNDRDDIFFLTFDEVESLLAGSTMFPAETSQLAKLRKSAHEKLSESTPPDRFELAPGDYWRDRGCSVADSSSVRDDRSFSGTGVCGGQVVGKAVVLTDPSQFDQVAKGDILVTRQTDPGWGPVLFLVRGLVMERGGMLSHGAILAREYGIPTVVDVRDATRQIETGETIRINGDCGVVEKLD